VFSPDILLMDEPLGALDKSLRQAIQLELKALHRKIGVTIVYVTHDQEEALFLSDRVVVLRSGRIAQVASPEELYERAATCFIAQFLGDCNLIPATVIGADADGMHVVVESGEAVRVAKTVPVAEGATVMLACRPENLSITDALERGQNGVGAVVEDVIFLGGSRKVILRHGTRSLTAVVTGRDAARRVKPGDRVVAAFPPAHAFLLPVD
jgi:putative spermidine/putrescine transport system ATP-binding protein